MLKNLLLLTALVFTILIVNVNAQADPFVSVKGQSFYTDGNPYRFIGANYWYGSLLGLERDKKRGVDRLRRELDFLKVNGVTNLRLMGGAEGEGLLNGVMRVGPSLQPENGKFDPSVLDGLDLVLAEMGKRKMKAVIFLSNNWEWSGGFQQYLIWNGVISAEWLTRKPSWDELRDNVAKFYSCKPCIEGYDRQMKLIVSRTNVINGKRYADDPVIMAWEIANEPRPMRPSANDKYRSWLRTVSAAIKALDKNHLVTLGHEGSIGTESIELFETVHADPNVDYLTIHIWPKNWGWFADGKMADGFPNVVAKTEKYIADNAAVAARLNKPLVIEEFGLPRDGQSFDPASPATLRNKYYKMILDHVGTGGIAGANFWAFAGIARPVAGQVFWKAGDDRTGDPPMEEQGLNSVFDSDRAIWKLINSESKRIRVK